jgi:hypothetical protein
MGLEETRRPTAVRPWISERMLLAGDLAHASPEPVVISANLGFDRGTRYLVNEGLVGVVLPDVAGGPVA